MDRGVILKMFGSGISYLTVDLIRIWKSSGENDFAEKRDRYLAAENPPDASYYRQLDYQRMKKMVRFIDRYLDSVTPENEMKMEIYFNRDQPAFIDDEVNTRLFNFSYADKVYAFARENGLSIRIHTIVWYWHVPRQLTEYLENRSVEDRQKLTYQFIRTYLQCLKDRYPDACSMELINEIAADPDEIRILRQEGKPVYRIKTDPQVTEFCPDFLDVGAKRADMLSYIRAFQAIKDAGDTDTWRCYAIESRETGAVMGALTFSKQSILHEYELGWMMIGEFAGEGYASEAAEAFAEDFCRTRGIDYLIAVMDVNNPASRRTAEKSGFRLFEKRTVYDYHRNRYCDDYYYFRRYWSGCTLKDRYYGDSPYYGRTTSDRIEDMR